MQTVRSKRFVALAFTAFGAAGFLCAQDQARDGGFRHRYRLVDEEFRSRDASSGPPSTAITPSQMQSIYGFNLVPNQGAGQTIALIDWFDAPNIESDLGVFDTQYSLPSCTTANGCFVKLFSGSKPRTNGDSALEISLDVEWAHAIAPAAKIMLVEAPNSNTSSLLTAIDTAVANGATVVSMSFGGGESSAETTSWDQHFQVTGVTFTASAGDSGHSAQWPAVSPYVIGVGGTTLSHNGGTWTSETAWSCNTTVSCSSKGGTGGGTSKYEAEPSYQLPFQNQNARGIPDLAYDADPNTGVAIYDSTPYAPAGFKGGWIQIGGTSAGAPQIAAMIAIANSQRVAGGKSNLSGLPSMLYNFTADYHDITSGKNGSCSICSATPGYDFVTGLGTPEANALIPALVGLP